MEKQGFPSQLSLETKEKKNPRCRIQPMEMVLLLSIKDTYSCTYAGEVIRLYVPSKKCRGVPPQLFFSFLLFLRSLASWLSMLLSEV